MVSSEIKLVVFPLIFLTTWKNRKYIRNTFVFERDVKTTIRTNPKIEKVFEFFYMGQYAICDYFLGPVSSDFLKLIFDCFGFG